MGLHSGDTLFVCGTYDDQGGRPSKIGKTMFEQMHLPDTALQNGGYFGDLEDVVKSAWKWKKIYWLAKVDEERRSLSKRIKVVNEMAFLAGSMRTDAALSFADRIHYALERGANLMVEFYEDEGRYQGRLFDPLGNIFTEYLSDFAVLGSALERTAHYLSGFTKVPATKVGERKMVPVDEAFLRVVRSYAMKSHAKIAEAIGIKQPMGNASFRFRCQEGFPSFREEESIYVSRRHLDKRTAGADGFVAVERDLPVKYYGDVPPSVDTAIQVRLYQWYPYAKYMIHGHVNIVGAPMTARFVPCGRIEEAQEIISLFPDREAKDFAVNLKGHGSLIVMEDLSFMEKIRYYPRRIPQYQDIGGAV